MPAEAEPAPAPAAPGPKLAYYAPVLDDAEREAYLAARDLRGIDDEVALLRVWVRKTVERGGVSSPDLMRAVDALAKALIARLKLEPGAGEQLEQALKAALDYQRDVEGNVDP